MKHSLRHEKNCLNCGHLVEERFCTHCGQENTDPKESVGHLIKHFFADITHYDSKFFTTIKDLLFKPGFLTKEYAEGKRVRYLNPIRMYVFISLIFFIVLSLKKSDHHEPDSESADQKQIHLAEKHIAGDLRQKADRLGTSDTLRSKVMQEVAASLDSVVADTAKNEAIGLSFGTGGFTFTLVENKYNSVKEYDSAQNALPENERDDALLRLILRTNINLKSRYGSRSQVIVAESFEHSIPKLMFVFLPLFALYIMILHSRKKFYYTQHAIFSIHFHSFAFLVLMIVPLVKSLFTFESLYGEITFDSIVLGLLIFYLTVALKNNYQQVWWLALIKALVISVAYIATLILGLILLAVLIFFTA